MSLPLPYRPQGVIDFIKEEEEEQLRASPVEAPLDKKAAFLDQMIRWYRKLSKNRKSQLTKKQLRYQAFVVAHRVKLAYDDIPDDFMKVMVKECGLVCYISQRALSNRAVREQQAIERAARGGESTSSDDDDDPEKKAKKFVDLTREDELVGAEAGTPEEKKEHPEGSLRMQAIASLADKNVVYWDYDMSHWKTDDGRDLSKYQSAETFMSNNSEYNNWDN